MRNLTGQELPIRQYRFTLQAEQKIVWPDYAGSMLRGSFGHGLRDVSCLTDSKSCENCPLLNGCQYTVIFNPLPQPELGARYSSTPAPYLMQVDMAKGQELSPGDKIQFEMTLFGDAAQQLSTLILAWQRACFKGLGKGKGRARLLRVDVFQPEKTKGVRVLGAWQQVYRHDQPAIQPHYPVLRLPEFSHKGGIQLLFKTPVRIQYRGKFINSTELDVYHLFQALVRKVQLYAQTYLAIDLGSPPEIPEHSVFKKQLTVYQWQRYSNRQKQAMKFDGLVGEVGIHMLDPKWLIWLWLGQYTHLGKNTTFGLGHYSIRELHIPAEDVVTHADIVEQ